MFCSQHQNPRQLTWAIFLICFVFLTIRIGGVHAHQHILVEHANTGVAGAETLGTSFSHHIEVGLFHQDHSDLHDHHGDSEPNLETVVHHDIKVDALSDAFGKTLKLSQQQFSAMATVLLWQLMPAPPSVIPRYRAPTGGPQTPRLRPPSCGPPKFFIA